IIQNQRQSKTNEYPKSNLYPNPTTNPTLSRLPYDQGFCSPSNHLLDTCFPLPAEETETEQACKSHGAGRRPARVVTHTHTHTHTRERDRATDGTQTYITT